MNIASNINDRISLGKSRRYPLRKVMFYQTQEYIFCNHTCTVYIKNTHSYADLSERVFETMLRSYWAEEKREERYRQRILSYNRKINDDDNADEYIDLIVSDVSIENELISHNELLCLHKNINKLKSPEKEIIMGIFFNHKTEEDMAKDLNKSRDYIHYHKNKALKTIGEAFTEDYTL